MSCPFTFHASITVVLTPAVKIVQIRRQSEGISLCPARDTQKMKAGKNVIDSNETYYLRGKKERIFPLQYRIIQSHNTPMQHIVVLQYMYLILCLNISTSVSHNSSFFCSGKNWDTNSGAKGITCFILSTDLPHTPNLVHTASNIGGKKLL